MFTASHPDSQQPSSSFLSTSDSGFNSSQSSSPSDIVLGNQPRAHELIPVIENGKQLIKITVDGKIIY